VEAVIPGWERRGVVGNKYVFGGWCVGGGGGERRGGRWIGERGEKSGVGCGR